ncbi:MAG: FAD/FMN-containing dehydrogenase [Mycobacterium sp.]|jgi:hypothetical protein|nr:FAD/FMN-containing dehydrogenase [Mycobacterium sp.]
MSQHLLERPASHNDDALDALAALLPGKVTLPSDPSWEADRHGWTVSVDQRPVAVVMVTDAQDVVTATRFAISHGFAVSAQPVGHGATTAIDGTILLRTRGLQEISVDAAARVARVGSGVKWGELLEVSGEYGLTGLAGSSPDPSVVGFSVCGGLSWFGRKYGLAAHSILAVELVDANGELRRVTEKSDPQLFWAVRGGGGDFGVVTAMEIELFPAPHVYGGRLLWPIEMALPVLRAFRDITKTAPDELTLWAHLIQFPPIPDVPEPIRGKSFVSVDVAYLGSADEAEELLMPLRGIPAQFMDGLDTVPLAALGSICMEPVDPMPTMDMAGLLRDFDNAAIDALLAVAGVGSGSPLTIVQIRHLGGAIARGTDEDGPAGAVEEPYQLFCLGIPMAPPIAAAVDITFASIRNALRGYLTDRTFFTFLGCDDDSSQAFAPGALERLQDIKRCVDPRGVVRSNRPVIR